MILGKGRDNWMSTGIINGYLEVRRRRRGGEATKRYIIKLMVMYFHYVCQITELLLGT